MTENVTPAAGTDGINEQLERVRLWLHMDMERIADEDEDEQDPEEKSYLIALRDVLKHMDTQAKRIAELEQIVNRLPKTSDGVPFFIGDTLYHRNDEPTYWGPAEVLSIKVDSISHPASFREYRGDFTVSGSGDSIEGGNLDFYANRDACPKLGFD